MSVVATKVAWALFGVGLLAGLANTVGILASAAGRSDYYPPGRKDWTHYALWGLSHTVNGAILVLTYLQYGTLPIPAPVAAGARRAVGHGAEPASFADATCPSE